MSFTVNSKRKQIKVRKMADAEAIREARKRKILQSSENRLNRVTGRQLSAEEGNNSSTNIQDDTKLISMPGDIKQSSTSSQNASSFSGSETATIIRHRQISSDTCSDQQRTSKSTVKISPIKRPSSTQDNPVSQNESLNSSRSSSDAKMILKHFEFLRIVMCIMVAYLCRRVLVTGYGVFYFQTVILPFACMEAAFFLFKNKVLHNVTLPHKSSMLVGLLMLCGIKPQVLQLYNKMMGYITAASEDFALFFLSFMMANMVMS